MKSLVMSIVRKQLPSLERLRQAFILTEHGALLWNEKRAGVSYGKEAGSVISTDGYRYVCLDRRKYPAHRIVYTMSRGVIPQGVIDHVDGNKLNNSPNNLRDTTQSLNLCNIHNPRKSNTSVTGVYLEKRTKTPTWYAQIKVNDNRINLGTFPSLEQATAARRKAELKYFGKFAPNGEK